MKESTRKRYANVTQCRSCEHCTGIGCKILTTSRDCVLVDAVDEWQANQTWKSNHYENETFPSVDAEGCPGWRSRFAN